MFKIEDILNRLETYFKTSTKSALARKLDVPAQYPSQWIKRATIPYEILLKFCFAHNVSARWLFLGEGSIDASANAEIKDYFGVTAMQTYLMPDESMSPRFRRGELLFLAPFDESDERPEDGAVYLCRFTTDSSETVRELYRIGNSRRYRFRALNENGPGDFELERDEFTIIGRVVGRLERV